MSKVQSGLVIKKYDRVSLTNCRPDREGDNVGITVGHVTESHSHWQKSHRLKVEAEPTMPKFDPIQCTEAVMAATNREAELEAMQFVDADSEVEGDDETDANLDDDDEEEDEEMKEKEAQPTSEPMEVEEPPFIPSTSMSSSNDSTTAIRGSTLRRSNAFKVRRPPTIPLKWDLSIVACPYPVPEITPTIFQNLPAWLATSPHTVSLAQTETKTSADGSSYSAPIRDASG